MTADDGSAAFRRVRELFEQALDLPDERRTAFLDNACGHDLAVRSEIDQLLSCDTDASVLGSLLDRGPQKFLSGMLVSGGSLRIGGRVGPYALRSVLGRGGMGTVYEAEQDEPRRRVALKVLSLVLADEQAVRRFKWEAEVLANLRHPAIAQVHAVGVHQAGDIELPWFAMELVPGARDLIRYSRAHSLSLRQRLELLLQVCDAVHHGHLQGVVHRDLKPQNVLVDEDGHAKVIDFGIARNMAKDAQLTDGGVVLGTLHYMSPEQLRGESVDLRSDIYSLGVVAFELLAGRRPFVFVETTHLIVAQTVQNQEAPRLSTVVRGIDRDLEVVVQKALRRDADERYASATEFADDLRAFLAARPVRARAPSTFYQVRMFARRRRGLVASVAVICSLVVLALLIVVGQNTELAHRSRQLVQQNAQLAEDEQRLLLQNVELQRRERVARRVAHFARDFLHESSLMAARGVDYTVREALDVAAENIASESFEDAEIEAELRQLIGSTYRSLSLPGVAIPHLQRTRELWLAVDGPRSRRAVAASLSLVVALREHGRVDDAEQLVESLPSLFDADGRGEDALWWRVQHNRAYIMRHVGRLRAAETLYRTVLAGRERAIGLDADATIATMHNLGVLMLGLQKPEQARELLSEAVARAKRSDHPATSTLQIVDNLAEAWRDLGDLDRAAERHRETMAGFEALVGPDHHITIGCGYHLLKVLYRQGQHDELETLARDLLARCERTFGHEDYRTMDVLQALAAAVGQRGDVQQAVRLTQRAFDAVNKGRGTVHPAAFHAGHNLCRAQLAASDQDGALSVTKHLVSLLARDPSPADQLPAIVPGLTWLLRARALTMAERSEDAMAAATQASRLLSGVVGEDDARLLEARQLTGDGR